MQDLLTASQEDYKWRYLSAAASIHLFSLRAFPLQRSLPADQHNRSLATTVKKWTYE